ncbi:MAG: hypothetical protein H7256_04650 [Bdellovibrio sp.]|nr:hypothetical protein [Bdellovibrio sp.]
MKLLIIAIASLTLFVSCGHNHKTTEGGSHDKKAACADCANTDKKMKPGGCKDCGETEAK